MGKWLEVEENVGNNQVIKFWVNLETRQVKRDCPPVEEDHLSPSIKRTRVPKTFGNLRKNDPLYFDQVKKGTYFGDDILTLMVVRCCAALTMLSEYGGKKHPELGVTVTATTCAKRYWLSTTSFDRLVKKLGTHLSIEPIGVIHEKAHNILFPGKKHPRQVFSIEDEMFRKRVPNYGHLKDIS